MPKDWSSSMRSDDAGGNMLFPPRPVLLSVARCFPQFLSGMLSIPFQHLSSSLGAYRLDQPAPMAPPLTRWPPLAEVDAALHICG
jgi:hypothetical protein